MAAAQLRFSPLFRPPSPARFHHFPAGIRTFSIPLRSTNPNLFPSLASPDLDNGNSSFGGSGGGNNNGNGKNWNSDNDEGNGRKPSNPLGLLLAGWNSRVTADPEFPFKVLMEELVGLTATAAGDMASRPNFGLSELDFVFSTLIVGSIVNFVLMYLLAPTSTAAATAAAASSLPSYIFEPGNFPLSSRILTLFVKGATFAAVGFAAGLAGTAISNGLVALRGISEEEEEKKAGPPTVLNAATWALQLGVSSNLRYQMLNAVEFAMAKGMPAGLFKVTVMALRFLNNAVGGMSFVTLARITGAQKKVEEEKEKEKEV